MASTFSLCLMSASTKIANSAALVARHEWHIAAETRHQNGEKRKSNPTPGPVAVRVGTLAGVNVVALSV